MQKYRKLPTMTGKQLLALLMKDGWISCGQKTHGVGLTKMVGHINLVTVIPANRPVVDFVLSAILGPQQTRIGKKGLLELVNKYGL